MTVAAATITTPAYPPQKKENMKFGRKISKNEDTSEVNTEMDCKWNPRYI